MRLLQAQGNASPTVNQQLFLTLDHMTQIEKEYKYKSGIAIKSHACHIIPTKTKYIHSLGVSVLVFASLPFLDFFGFFGDLAGFLGLVPLEALGFLGAPVASIRRGSPLRRHAPVQANGGIMSGLGQGNSAMEHGNKTLDF